MGFDQLQFAGLFWLPIAAGMFAVMALAIGIGLLLRQRWAGDALEDMRRIHAEEVDLDPKSRAGRSLMGASWIDFSRLFRSDGQSDASHHGDAGGADGSGGAGD